MKLAMKVFISANVFKGILKKKITKNYTVFNRNKSQKKHPQLFTFNLKYIVYIIFQK